MYNNYKKTKALLYLGKYLKIINLDKKSLSLSKSSMNFLNSSFKKSSLSVISCSSKN